MLPGNISQKVTSCTITIRLQSVRSHNSLSYAMCRKSAYQGRAHPVRSVEGGGRGKEEAVLVSGGFGVYLGVHEGDDNLWKFRCIVQAFSRVPAEGKKLLLSLEVFVCR